MNAQEVANTLNAYSKLEEAAAEMPRSLRKALTEAAAQMGPDMNAVEVGMTRRASEALQGGGRSFSGIGSPTRRLRAATPSGRAPGSARISNKQLNSNISRAGFVEAILELVDEHHKAFNYINVATAITRIAKLARQQRRSGGSNAVIQDAPLASDERYVKLMGLVVQELQSFQAREVANVFSGFATLQTECGVTAELDLLLLLGTAMERVAPDMNAQNIANTLNAYSKLEEAAAEMPLSLRDVLSEAAERVAPDMNAQEVANSLNAYSKLDEIGLLLTSTRCPVETHLTATTSV